MHITCPTCAAVYRVDESAIGPNGRNVQCDACGAQWRQTPERKQTAEKAPERIPAIEEEDEERVVARPKTPGLEEAAELLQEMREESARTDSIDIFSDAAKAGSADSVAEDEEEPAQVEEAEAKEVISQQELKSIIASANRKSPKAEKRQGGGFRVGFILALMFVGALAFAYLANGLLAEQFPAAAGALGAYADLVDMVRGGVGSLAEGAMKGEAPAAQ